MKVPCRHAQLVSTHFRAVFFIDLDEYSLHSIALDYKCSIKFD